MRQKIVLAIVPDTFTKRQVLPPLGSLYVAAFLEKAGYDVKMIDGHAQRLSIDEFVALIKEESPAAVGICAITNTRIAARELIKKIKQEISCLIFTGGQHFSPTAHDALKNIPELDVVVKGEGELTAKEMLDCYFSGKGFENVLGLVFRGSDGVIIENPARPFIANLDDIPVPAWHLIDLSRYQATLECENQTKAIGVISSRGCPNQCVFCVSRMFWKCGFRRHSPKNFVDGLEFLNKTYGYRAFDIWDDTLTMVRSHVEEICREIIKRNLNIIWYARARVDTVDEELIKLMKESGCIAIAYGVESGSPKILKNIKKNITLDQVREAIKISIQQGLFVKAFFMFSLPGETFDDIKLTIKFIKELEGTYKKNFEAMTAYTIIYPGTELEQVAKQEGILPKNFTWNIDQRFPKAKFIGYNPSLPLYEPKGLPFEQVMPFVAKHYAGKKDLLSNIRRGFRKVKSVNDLKRVIIMGLNYYFKVKA